MWLWPCTFARSHRTVVLGGESLDHFLFRCWFMYYYCLFCVLRALPPLSLRFLYIALAGSQSQQHMVWSPRHGFGVCNDANIEHTHTWLWLGGIPEATCQQWKHFFCGRFFFVCFCLFVCCSVLLGRHTFAVLNACLALRIRVEASNGQLLWQSFWSTMRFWQTWTWIYIWTRLAPLMIEQNSIQFWNWIFLQYLWVQFLLKTDRMTAQSIMLANYIMHNTPHCEPFYLTTTFVLSLYSSGGAATPRGH